MKRGTSMFLITKAKSLCSKNELPVFILNKQTLCLLVYIIDVPKICSVQIEKYIYFLPSICGVLK